MCSGGANQTDDGGLLAGLAEVIGTGETDLVGVWTDNWQTVLAFSDLMSQWNVGMSGVIGLRYEALPLVLEMHGIKRKRQLEMFDGLRVMESAAITEINKR